MTRPTTVTSLITLAGIVCACQLLHAQDLETFQVPDLSPPAAPAPSGAESLPPPPDSPFVPDAPRQNDEPHIDEEPIPAPMVYPGHVYHGSALALLDTPPVPYPYPRADLWAGRCGGHETLVPCCCPPAWASIDALWLQRDGPDDFLLATDGNAATLRNDDFDFNYAAGVRVVYGEVVNCIPLELTYFGTHDWNSSIALDGMNNLDVPGAPGGGSFVNADRVEANYASELHSIELNTLRVQDCRLTYFAGVRYIDAEEDFALLAENNNDGLIAITGDNRLLGLQAGADWNYGCDAWCVGLSGRAGGYLNFAERDFLVNDGDNAANNANGENNDTEFAFAAQLQLGVTRHLGCGLKLRGGYEVLWIDGLVLAAEQLGAGGVANLDTDGSILYDGGYVGLEWHR